MQSPLEDKQKHKSVGAKGRRRVTDTQEVVIAKKNATEFRTVVTSMGGGVTPEKGFLEFWNILCLFFFWPCHAACGILLPQPGVEPVPPAVEAQSLNHWTAREVQKLYIFLIKKIYTGSWCKPMLIACHQITVSEIQL